MNQAIDSTIPLTSSARPRKLELSQRGKRALLFSVLAIGVAVAAAGSSTYWKLVGSRYVSTDDAYTDANDALMTSQIAGRVADVTVVDSEHVRQGDVLVVIDDTDATLALRQARADLVRARATVAAKVADVERTAIDLQRRQALIASGAVSGDELTAAKNSARDAHAVLEVARAAVALAQARVDQATVDLNRTVIRSPVDGVIARRQVELGEYVQPATPLLSVVPVSQIYVDANFKENQLAHVRAGQTVDLTSELYGRKVVFHGVVAGFSGGTGAAFALIPAQNATGNWIKVVQRLPVRIRLNRAELVRHPLRVGLSMDAAVDLRSMP
ncbi:MAG TPA: efflux RND transporter periplasmic adaptor subunit [Steroidobacteraceae bacterium]|nr:efflux RND transporter periplasmic adaptor subunit [Steroidobacteraceae bacterium]